MSPKYIGICERCGKFNEKHTILFFSHVIFEPCDRPCGRLVALKGIRA